MSYTAAAAGEVLLDALGGQHVALVRRREEVDLGDAATARWLWLLQANANVLSASRNM